MARLNPFISLLRGKKRGARAEASALNAGLIFYATGSERSMKSGVEKAYELLREGAAFHALTDWVIAQNRDPEVGLKKLEALA